MKLGYQGEENCYSYQVIKKYLDNNLYNKGFSSFESVFEALHYEEIDFAVIPIENSLGGCIFVNYDLFYKYNIKIHSEFHHEIKHSLYSLNPNKDNLKSVISHPQALQQCHNNIKKHNLKPEEFWDTSASLNEVVRRNDLTLGCIAPPNLGSKFNLFELEKNFNDQEKNITRFYLVSLKKRNLLHQNILLENLVATKNKFSGYFISKNKIGILNECLEEFKNNNYNLTKIESRPYLGKDRDVFSYIFYLEGVIEKQVENINGFELFGLYPLLNYNNYIQPSIGKLKVGIIGFGRFGQFIGEEMVNYGFDVYATSRTNYFNEAKKINITFLEREKFQEEMKKSFHVIILATSILSFESVLNSYPKELWENKLVVDVLSVKSFPYKVLEEYLPENDILLTHPMFGPDSAKSSGWNNKNFVYWSLKKSENKIDILTEFLEFWKFQGCNMIEMEPEEHDRLTANSQFLTHFIGRTLELLNCENTLVDTDGYKSLIKIKEHSINDSWDLFSALSKFNPKTYDTISKLKYQLFSLEEKLLPSNGNKIKSSSTSEMFSKIAQMKENNIDVINSAIGVPSWYPEIDYNLLNLSSAYTTSQGNNDLLLNLVKYYKKNHNLEIKKENLVIVSGGKPGIYLTLNLITKTSSKWLLPKPYWTSYPDMISLLNGETIFLESENCYLFSLEDVENNFKNELVNGIIICNPNNPTGYVYPEDFLENLVNICKKYEKYLIVDEVYLPLTNRNTLYSKDYSKMVVISSFAKYWALPGWRVGWVLANDEIIKNLTKIQSTILTCAPNGSQMICNHLLNTNFRPDLNILDKSKAKLFEHFKHQGWNLKFSKEASMYLFPVNKEINIEEYVDNLLSKGLAVMKGSAFGVPNGIRITLPNDESKLEKILNILK